LRAYISVSEVAANTKSPKEHHQQVPTFEWSLSSDMSKGGGKILLETATLQCALAVSIEKNIT